MKMSKKRREAAMRYVAAEKSDPFAYGRVMLHMQNGIASFGEKGNDAFYSADEFKEARFTADGQEYTATAYRNRRRP